MYDFLKFFNLRFYAWGWLINSRNRLSIYGDMVVYDYVFCIVFTCYVSDTHKQMYRNIDLIRYPCRLWRAHQTQSNKLHNLFSYKDKKMHTCQDVQLCTCIYYTDMFRSLLRPSSGCRTIRIQAIRYWFHKMHEKNLPRIVSK